MRLDKEDFDFDNFVNEILIDLKPLTKDRIVIKENEAKATVFADRYQIGQVFVNFITNALKYSKRNDKIIIRLNKNHKNVMLSVQDFGVGINHEHQQHIFERFYSVDSANETKLPGLGVGLYIASEIIKCHNGKIWVESKTGKGSVFSFSLPIDYVQQ